MSYNLGFAYGCQLRLASGSTDKLMSVCHVNQQPGECQGEVSNFRSRCSPNHVQPKKEPRARQTSHFIESCHMHAYQSVTKADANGDRGSCHLHEPRYGL